MSQTETAPAPESSVPPDPIVHKSYSLAIWIAMLAVVGATVLTIVDEMWLRRPYKKVQEQYQETYSAYLAKVEAKRRDFYDNVFRKVDEYTKLKQAADEAAAQCFEKAAAAQAELDTVTNQSRKLGEAVKSDKSEISALAYQAEDKAHAAGKSRVEDAPEAASLLADIAKVQAREITYTWTVKTPTGQKDDKGRATFTESEKSEKGKSGDLLVKALELEQKKAELQQVLGAANVPLTEANKKRDGWIAEHIGDLKYVLQNADDATKKVIAASGAAKYLDENVVTLKPDTLAAMKSKVDETFPHAWYDSSLIGEIKQIHIKEAANWVDRCETCHLNAREPMPITVESLKSVLGTAVGDLPAWDGAKINSMPLSLFTSHPNPELMKSHDPDRFGCSMCHNGNGVAITGVEVAHGENEHWLQPLHPKENLEAGCLQCHQQDLVLANGPRITTGKDTFRRAGCWGCHKYEGFNKEVDQITALDGRRKEIEAAKFEKTQRAENLRLLLGPMEDDDAAKARNAPPIAAERAALAQDVALLENDLAQVRKRLHEAYEERQRVGPNLKDVRIKIQREFLTEWIKNPSQAHKDASGRPFRPDTKMPAFRWWDNPDEEVKDVSAFIWQSALDPADFPEMKLPEFVPGDAKNGETLFKQKGCLICHSIGIGAERQGNDYAANLTNLVEKDRPEYVARWITHPRLRIVGFNPLLPAGKRDVSGAKESDPEIVWAQHTIMPNFRLSETEVRDIATYLTSSKRSDVKYEEPTWLDDKTRFERGRKLVLFQGCAGCHEIRGLEDEKGIGTELTTEGSKPIDRLDFGHLTTAAERGTEPLKGASLLEDAGKLFEKDREWYRPRDFFVHKIAKPDVYDDSKYLPDRFTRLRMPQFRFDAQQILDLTTFVLGSVETQIPQSFRYKPDDAGEAIREGWWIVKKYNCQGCHQVLPTDEPALWKTPYFAAKLLENGGRDRNLPPSLVGAGFRLRPDFIAKFLRDPSLGGDRANPTSVRVHLPERMPTFDFSEDEIAKLVFFFEALAKQPFVYQPPVVEPLSDTERKAAFAIFNDKASCTQCHIVNGMPVTTDTKAPNFSFAPQRLRPEWARRWIADPPSMQPATAMLKLFGDKPGPDGKYHYLNALPELKGVPLDHVELMMRYVLSGQAGK